MIVDVDRTKKHTTKFIETMAKRHFMEVWRAEVHLMNSGHFVDALSNFDFDKVLREVRAAISKIKYENGNKLESKGIPFEETIEYSTDSPSKSDSWGRIIVLLGRYSKKQIAKKNEDEDQKSQHNRHGRNVQKMTVRRLKKQKKRRKKHKKG